MSLHQYPRIVGSLMSSLLLRDMAGPVVESRHLLQIVDWLINSIFHKRDRENVLKITECSISKHKYYKPF